MAAACRNACIDYAHIAIVIVVLCSNSCRATSSRPTDVRAHPNCTHVQLSGASIANSICLSRVDDEAAADASGVFVTIVCQPNCFVDQCHIAALFARSPNISRLQFDRNNLTALPPDGFRLAGQLTELDLSYNRIAKLEAAQFCGARNLQSLRLSHNRLLAVDQLAFECLRHLAELFLDHNQLQRFEAILPPGVEALYVQGNAIEVVSAVLSSSNVRQLDVSSNALVRFDAANGISRLEWLNVARNRLQSLQNITSSHVRLRQLDASHNPIAAYTIFTFAPLHRLDTLRLRAAGLLTFGVGLFGEHAPVHLRVLDIGANRLRSADWTALGKLHALRELSVTDGGLSDVGALDLWLQQPQSTVDDDDDALSNGSLLLPLAKRLDRLWLAGNQFNCTYLRRLQTQLRPDAVSSSPEQAVYVGSNVNGVPCAECGDDGCGGGVVRVGQRPVAARELCLAPWWSSIFFAIATIVESVLLVAVAMIVWMRWKRPAQTGGVVTWERMLVDM